MSKPTGPHENLTQNTHSDHTDVRMCVRGSFETRARTRGRAEIEIGFFEVGHTATCRGNAARCELSDVVRIIVGGVRIETHQPFCWPRRPVKGLCNARSPMWIASCAQRGTDRSRTWVVEDLRTLSSDLLSCAGPHQCKENLRTASRRLVERGLRAAGCACAHRASLTSRPASASQSCHTRSHGGALAERHQGRRHVKNELAASQPLGLVN